ncbi:biotin/lipoyl-binding protein [Agromyces protaetiae]|uniref:biotin carboxylase n=1 Tax=Agromyces protaetiae TaxID=2509455 RepID=A0A4P6FDY1_9MICO|nr:biotin carboxylase N-terminal domain-containing protein [Agromyces protaetiae]QAY74342.1 biotin/lipoyl-binding protein [Agromyces protaetiae]
MTQPPFDRVLVANRGEIAVRVIRTLRRLGIRAIAVYSDADADAPHIRLADEAIRLGPAPASESYLDPEKLVAAALATGAQAVHPGYGFLSEHVGFARACADAGMVFIGPGETALEVMGDKIRAKRHVAASGVPVVPGVDDADPAPPGGRLSDDALVEASRAVGFPAIVKPSAGGGGKGMQLAHDAAELAAAIPAARRIARAAFGDDSLLVERFIERPRHIEVQILADAHGHVVHLGERECSLQRRHQKVVEEAPSPFVDADTRERLGQAACAAAASVGYVGAGTVEFLVSDASPGEFFFIEMNTRLQVEHPVTELVTGLDLVEQQVRVAAGEPLAFGQADVALRGHAVEARVYAESPERGFLPSTGDVLAWRAPTGDGVRVDAGIATGSTVTAHYDPMLAKVIAWGSDRAEALDRLDAALADTVVLGVETNLAFLRRLLALPEVREGALTTELIDALPDEPLGPASPALRAAAAGALAAAAGRAEGEAGSREGAAHAWQRETGWRPGAHRAPRVRLEPVAGVAPGPVLVELPIGARNEASAGTEASARSETSIAPDGTVWAHTNGRTAAFRPVDRRTALDARLARERGGGGTGSADPVLRAPMPGTVTAVFVADGDPVETGDAILAIEAMKMEHRMTATVTGAAFVSVAVGDQVARDQAVARIEAGAAAPEDPHEGTDRTAAADPAQAARETRSIPR